MHKLEIYFCSCAKREYRSKYDTTTYKTSRALTSVLILFNLLIVLTKEFIINFKHQLENKYETASRIQYKRRYGRLSSEHFPTHTHTHRHRKTKVKKEKNTERRRRIFYFTHCSFAQDILHLYTVLVS